MFEKFFNKLKTKKNNNLSKKIQIINFFKGFKKTKTQTKKTLYPKRINKIQLQLNLSKIEYKKILINLVIYSILIVLIILKTDIFKIKTINVISLDPNVNTILIEKNLSYLKNKLIFSIEKNELKRKIANIEQNIQKIDISKKYPDLIEISLSSYKTIFNTKINDKKYLITQNGVLIPKRNIKNNLTQIEIKNIKLPAYPLYKKFLNTEELNKINFIKNKLIENIVGLQIKNIIYYKKEKEVHFIINNDTRIIFDLVGDIKEKLKQLYVFNKENKNILKPGIVYIDNRIIGKIYYCPTEEKKQCEKNLNYIYNLKNN